MPRYHYDVSISRQKRFIRRFKKFLYFCFGTLVVVGLAIFIDSVRQQQQDNTETGAPVVTTVSPSIREFESPYFRFTTPSNWRRITDETTDKQFTYRSYRGDLVEQELKIFVNNTSADLSAIRVLPVRINENGKIIPGAISEHCSVAAGVTKASAPVSVTMEQVNFLCQVDGTNFLVVIGERGGGSTLNLKRPNGSTAKYSFIYRSSSVPPNSTDLIDILNAFTPL